jgi:chemotaxis signal transduction protein
MAQQASTLARSRKLADQQRIFTFFVQDMMFGMDVKNVLMLDQNVEKIQSIPVEQKGLCGVIKFQGVVVPVLDFAHCIGVESGIDANTKIIDVLTEREQDHVDWLNALEDSIRNKVSFTKATDPNQCMFGKWYNSFDTRDDTLRELLQEFDKPHRAIHALAEDLISLSDQGREKQALEKHSHERNTTLRRLRSLFNRAREQIQSGMRQVLLFVTTDGKTPIYAVLIDEINDVMTYDISEFQGSESGALAQIPGIAGVLSGIYSVGDAHDCLVLEPEKLTANTRQLAV